MPASAAMVILKALVFCLLRLRGCLSAGMNTHTMVGHRTAKYYGMVQTSPRAVLHNNAIQQHLDAVLGGADFPDFLFGCGRYADAHDAGEAAHWPPWQAAAVKFIRSRPDFDSGNWSLQTQRLIAFLYGVTVHFASDEFYEGLTGVLGRGQGFTATVASFNLNETGVGNEDEMISNLAGDFYVSFGMDEREIRPWERFFPINEIAEIYHNYYTYGHNFSNVTVASLMECKVLFDLGLWAEKEFGRIIFNIYSEIEHDVPLVEEHAIDMPLSGIDDMAVWATWAWERIARWLDEGPPASPEPRAMLKSQPLPPKLNEADAWLRDFIKSLEPLRDVAASLIAHNGTSLVMHMNASDPLAGLLYCGPLHLRAAVEEVLSNFVHFASRRSGREKSDGLISRALRIVSSDARSAAVTHPSRSIPSEAASGTQLGKPQQSVVGEQPVGYLGSALCAGDFDGDGVIDLAAGAYGNGSRGRPQEGSVTLTYANGTTQVLRGTSVHGRFGWAMAALDMNLDGVTDLAVSAPEDSWWNTTDLRLPEGDRILGDQARLWGRVFVFFGRKGSGLSEWPNLTISTSDGLTGLGMTLGTGDVDGDGQADLLIGCPMSSYRANSSWPDVDTIHRGALLAFIARESRDHGRLDARRDADLCLEGPSGYSWFGQSVGIISLVADRFLLVGAPGQRADSSGSSVGRLYVYRLGKNGSAISAVLELTMTGSEVNAEFGHALAVGDAFLAIGSPASGSSYGRYPRAGAVHLISSSSLEEVIQAHRGGDILISSVPFHALLLGDTAHGRFGWHVAFADVLGDGAQDLLVGAPLGSRSFLHIGSRETGAVYVWDGSHLPNSTIKEPATHASWSSSGSRARGRFGTATAPVEIPSSNGLAPVKGLAVGSPYADGDDTGGLEMAGIVDLFSLPAVPGSAARKSYLIEQALLV